MFRQSAVHYSAVLRSGGLVINQPGESYAPRLACREVMWENPTMPKASRRTFYARMDGKNRVLLHGAKYNQFMVRARPDGGFVLKPVVTVAPEEVISPKTLRTIKTSIASMKAGKRSKPVDLKKLAAMKL
jgi:hypothetical protein